ncbi:MAG: hypothetical protein AB7O90_18610, partial [Hyphomicrobium sp.]
MRPFPIELRCPGLRNIDTWGSFVRYLAALGRGDPDAKGENGVPLPFKVTGSNEGAAHFGFSTSLRDMARYSAETEARKAGGVGLGLSPGLGSFVAPLFNPFDIWIEGKFSSFHDNSIMNTDLDGHFGLFSRAGAQLIWNFAGETTAAGLGQIDVNQSVRKLCEVVPSSALGWLQRC